MDITSFAINVLLVFISPDVGSTHSTDNCNLQKSFETGFLTGRFTANWRASYYGGGLSLMYYEDANFDRREDAEIKFHPPAAIPRQIKLDTNRIASRFVEYHKQSMRNDPKFPPGFEIKTGVESIQVINGITWHKRELFVGGVERDTRREHRIAYFVHITSEKMYAVTLSVLLPEIPTVEKEFPCIMDSISLKKQ